MLQPQPFPLPGVWLGGCCIARFIQIRCKGTAFFRTSHISKEKKDKKTQACNNYKKGNRWFIAISPLSFVRFRVITRLLHVITAFPCSLMTRQTLPTIARTSVPTLADHLQPSQFCI